MKDVSNCNYNQNCTSLAVDYITQTSQEITEHMH